MYRDILSHISSPYAPPKTAYPVHPTVSANSIVPKEWRCHRTRKRREYGTSTCRKSTRSTEDDRLLFPWGQRRSRKCGSPFERTVDVYLCPRWPRRSDRWRDQRREIWASISPRRSIDSVILEVAALDRLWALSFLDYFFQEEHPVYKGSRSKQQDDNRILTFCRLSCVGT